MQPIELNLSNPISTNRLRSDYYKNDQYRNDDSYEPVTPQTRHCSRSSFNANYGTVNASDMMGDSVFTESTGNDDN